MSELSARPTKIEIGNALNRLRTVIVSGSMHEYNRALSCLDACERYYDHDTDKQIALWYKIGMDYIEEREGIANRSG